MKNEYTQNSWHRPPPTKKKKSKRSSLIKAKSPVNEIAHEMETIKNTIIFCFKTSNMDEILASVIRKRNQHKQTIFSQQPLNHTRHEKTDTATIQLEPLSVVWVQFLCDALLVDGKSSEDNICWDWGCLKVCWDSANQGFEEIAAFRMENRKGSKLEFELLGWFFSLTIKKPCSGMFVIL